MSANPYHLGVLICGILTATGLLGIGAIFALYRLEEWLNRNDQPAPEPEQPQLDGPPCMVTYPTRCDRVATHWTRGWLTCDQHAPAAHPTGEAS